eukprot:4579253-Pyramimonas_sp.AAC.1
MSAVQVMGASSSACQGAQEKELGARASQKQGWGCSIQPLVPTWSCWPKRVTSATRSVLPMWSCRACRVVA